MRYRKTNTGIFRLIEHLLRSAADEDAAQPALAVRRHHDQVAFPPGGDLQDRFVRIVAGDVHGLAGDTRLPGGALDEPEILAAVSSIICSFSAGVA